MIFRPAQFSDYENIAKLHADSWQKTYRNVFSEKFLEQDVEQDRKNTWYDRLRNPLQNQYVTVAVKDQRIVGFSCIYLNDDPIYGTLLDNLHVASDLHKSGVGKSLMKECAKYIYEKSGNKKMYLWVFELNENARKMYDHLGAANVETVDKKHTDNTSARACRYCWDDVSVFF